MRVLKFRRTDRPRAVNRKRHADNRARVAMPVVRGDQVQVVRGDDKGKRGEVIRVYRKKNRVVVKGVNIVKKHRRARRPEEQSGIIEMPAPVNASNVMLLDAKTGAPTRTRARIDADGTKERVGVKTGEPITTPR